MISSMSDASSSPRPGASRGVSSFGTSSHYGTTAGNLNLRRIAAVETPYVSRFPHDAGAGAAGAGAAGAGAAGAGAAGAGAGDDNDDDDDGGAEGPAALRAFVSELMLMLQNHDHVLEETNVNANCDCLLGVLSGVYRPEASFNAAVFDAVAECLGKLAPMAAPVTVDKKIILTAANGIATAVDRDGVEYEYATGLAREAELPPDNGGCFLKSVARMDHAWVIYRRPTGNERTLHHNNWKVWRALAVVDFKRDYAKWNIVRSDRGRGNVDAESLELSRHENGPLAQVIMYAIAHAAPGIASLGEFPPLIPFAVVQCRTKTSDPVTMGWLHGNLVTPNACGERFWFNVDAYGPMHTQKTLNGPALAAYLDVMAKGLQVARRWMQSVQAERALPSPHPLSGRIVRFGEWSENPNLTVISNATLLATPVLRYCADGSRHYRVHQGELFRASVDLKVLQSTLTDPDEHRVYWCRDTYPGNATDVLIKVTSQACFNLLIPSTNAYLYTVSELSAAVRVALSNSLYGFYQTSDSCGVVQLLPDLRRSGYEPIPDFGSLDAADRGALWRAFAALVREVLVPLARAKIVHSDIRTGHNVTANLLYKKGSMRLIDLDSLCNFKVLSGLPGVKDRRYLSPDRLPGPLRNAMGFVLGQVLCAGEVWLGAIRHNAVNANDAIRRALPRRRPPQAPPVGDHEASVRRDDGGGGGGGATGVFDGRAYDTDGNFVAVANAELIDMALRGYQAKFDQLPPPAVGAVDT